MPSTVLNSEALTVNKYAVIGVYGVPKGDPHLVTEVAIALEDAIVKRGGTVRAARFGFEQKLQPPPPHDPVKVHLVGVVDGLLDDPRAVEKIATFLHRIPNERYSTTLDRNRLNPPFVDKVCRRTFCQPYTCVTFVLAAFQKGDIKILDVENADYPTTPADLIKRVFHRLMNRGAAYAGAEFPCEDSRIPLPGHLFHALNQPIGDEARRNPRTRPPYLPKSPDEAYFPGPNRPPTAGVASSSAVR